LLCTGPRALADIAADTAFNAANALFSVPGSDFIRDAAKDTAALAEGVCLSGVEVAMVVSS